MPRPEDIAWKFVVRLEGKRWRCPYCHKGSSGSVTRVKSHFLKQPKEGIAYCTKVPEHIRTIMELLLNHEIHNKDDIAWKFVNRLEDNKWQCRYCSVEFSGDLTGVKGHLFKVPIEGINICTEVPDHIRKLMQSLFNEVAEEDSRGANGQSSTEPQSCQVAAQAEAGEHESREANGESSTVPQSRDMPTQVEVAQEESRDANSQSFIEPPQWRPLSSDFFPLIPLEQMVSPPLTVIDIEVSQPLTVIDIEVNSDQQSQAEHQSHESSAMPLSAQISHAPVYPQHQSVTHQSETRNVLQNPTALTSTALMDMDSCIPSSSQAPNNAPHGSTGISNFNQQYVTGLYSGQQSQAERQFPQSSTMPSLVQNSHGDSTSCSTDALAEELSYLLASPHQPQCSFLSPRPDEMPMNGQQIPTGTSSFQYNQLPATGNSHCLQDSDQHSQLQTPMDIVSSIAPQHTSDSHIIDAPKANSQVPEMATNTIGSLSSQDVNRCSPTMNLWIIYANDEEIRNLKRKVEELDDKEAVIKEQMEIESPASSVRKKPRILVERWLKETERARNNFQKISQAHAETLPPKEQVGTLMREVEELIEQTLPQTLLIEDRDAKGIKFLERKLTGEVIRRNIELIWDHLTENHACKLGIYGMGGVGKTTIMMHIHNKLLKDATFDGVVFITVSKDCSIYKLQSDIWKALEFGVMEDGHEKKRAAMLLEQLERKKNCVLILDDVWERLDLEEVGIPDGCKLVLTTRSFDVCCQMHCQEKIKIKPLSQKEAESLFLEELGFEVPLNSETKAIAKSIVKECAGLPIGVITMARSMLGATDVFEWRDALERLKESSLGLKDMENKVLMILKFSYDRLGDPDVQQCFLSCALYPEDESLPRQALVEFFIDQGLIDGLNTRKKQYDRGLTILKKLIKVCLLEYNRDYMKMHDLIRDMALQIMSPTSIVKARKGLTRIPSEEYWTDALEKVSLKQNCIREFPLNMSPNCPKLSTLLLDFGLSRDASIPDSFFKKLWGLKVLDLSGCDLRELPNSISDLVNLRALLLSWSWELRRIPYLGKLTSLRKLDVSGCRSLEALEGLEMLMNLRYLALSFSLRGRLPKGVLGGLLNLQHLKFGLLDGEDITKLRALEKLECYFEDADDFNKCVRVIEQVNPQYYYLCMYKKFIDDEIFIESEHNDAVEVQPRNEKRVRIVMWSHAIVSMEGECTGIFILIPRDVQALLVEECNGITNFSDIGPLDYLEELEIYRWENLGVLCGGRDEEVIDIRDSPATTPTPTPTPLLFPSLRVLKIAGCPKLKYLSPLLFPSLRDLEIEGCPKLKYLFRHGSKSNFPHLREISISECEEMVGIIAAATSPPPHPLPAFPSLESIYVHKCHKMKRVVESEWMPHFPNLRRIDTCVCSNMEEMIGGPPPHLPAEKISLEYLSTFNCGNMRKLFPHEWLLHLRNLQEISVSSCEGMVEMISGAGQGQEGSIMTPANNTLSSFQSSISLPNLKQLDLYELPQLKSICEVPISCGSMDNLKVYKCPELKEIPLQLRLRDIDIEDLPHIWVDDEEKWKTLKWDDPNAQAILQPYLQKGEHVNRPLPHECQIPPDAIELDTKGKDLW